MSGIVFYISSHGFGHSTREIDVINHIPETVDIEIVTAAPRWLFEKSIHRPFSFHSLHHDPGIIQKDALHNDPEQTYESWRQLLQDYPRLAQEEADRISPRDFDIVVGDISPFAVAVADLLGIPSLFIANFSWDWIFSVFLKEAPQFEQIIHSIAEYYNRASLVLKTPLAGDLSVFPHGEEIPLIVRSSQLSKDESRTRFDLNQEDKVVLLSFGGMGIQTIQRDYFARYSELTFLTFDPKLTGPDNVVFLHPRETYHPDAIAACDVALAKLGYGLVTECIAHQTPILYPPRYGFPEHDVLARESKQWIDTIPIDAQSFFSGNWDCLTDFFQQYDSADKGKSLPAINGGEVAAKRLLSLIHARC